MASALLKALAEVADREEEVDLSQDLDTHAQYVFLLFRFIFTFTFYFLRRQDWNVERIFFQRVGRHCCGCIERMLSER